MRSFFPAFRRGFGRPEWRGYFVLGDAMAMRTVVFIDYQNVYHRAREVFGGDDEPPTFGHVRPRRLGVLLKQLGETRGETRDLTQVRVYRGEPTSKSHPRLQAAYQRQLRMWRRDPLVQVVTRPLRYMPTSWDYTGRPTAWDKGREKGIDVLIALDLAVGAIDNAYDLAILVSGDTDLVPAVEMAADAGKRVENAVWWPDVGSGKPLRSKKHQLWAHRLNRQRFEMVRDDSDYATPVGATGQDCV